MTENIWIALITVGSLQLLGGIGAWVQVQVRLKALEIRQNTTDALTQRLVGSIDRQNAELHKLTVELSRWRPASPRTYSPRKRSS